MGFSRLHIFRYSRREGTLAARMPGQVPVRSLRNGVAACTSSARTLKHRFNSASSADQSDVLWETAEDLGDILRWSGLTPNYVRVTTETPADDDLMNRVVPTEITEVGAGGLVGRILNSEFGIRNPSKPS